MEAVKNSAEASSSFSEPLSSSSSEKDKLIDNNEKGEKDEIKAEETSQQSTNNNNNKPKKGGTTTTDRPRRTLFCLTQTNPIRKFCYFITEWKMFEYFLLTTILATCVCLALATPYPNDDSDPLNHQLEEFEIVFTVIFTVECVMNIIAQGFILHEGAYLRGGIFNILDFFVVAVGLLEPIITKVMPGFDPKALRAFRVLRPLKLVSGIPALQILVNAILKALIPLSRIALLVIFIVLIYGIIGLEMFEGQLHKTCFDESSGEMMKDPVNCGGGYNCEDREGMECRTFWAGPNDGITNFDNIGLAVLTVYQCISFAGWTTMMYHLQDAMGEGWEWIYFISMVLLGAFLAMNLVLGVLSGEFSKQKEKAESRIQFLKIKEEQVVEAQMEAYLDWITRGNVNANVVEMEETEEEKMMKNPRRRACYNLLKSQSFFWTIILLVFWNTAVGATEHYRQPQWLEDFQEATNVCFVTLFVFEMLLKMYTLGLTKYFTSLFNRFDFFATIASVIEMIGTTAGIMSPIGVSVLRCTRLLRVFKITRYWSGMTSLVTSLLESVQSIVSLLFLLFLFMKIFALLGMQLFGGKFSFDSQNYTPRANFDSFSTSLLTIFQVLTGEDWNIVMFVGINAFGGISSSNGLVSIIYFVILFTLGNLILLNVFLAIAVDNLECEEPDKDEGSCPPEPHHQLTESFDVNNTPKVDDPIKHEINKENLKPTDETTTNSPAPPEEEDPPLPPIPEGSSFFLLSQTNSIRVFSYKFLTNLLVSNFLLVCILISSALMAAEDPVYENSPRNKMLEKIDYFFTFIFTIELSLKLLIYGLLFHKGAFCRSFSNVLDIVVVCVSLIGIFSSGGGASSLKILRVCRVLRPLRAVTKLKQLKLVIDSMIVSIKVIVNILIVTNLLQFMYANMGVQLFKGAFYQCTDAAKKTEEECQGWFITFEDQKGNSNRPVALRREWVNSSFNFDSVPNGILTLFVVSTFGGWPQILYKSIDAAGEGQAPVHDNRKLVSLFYISYLIIVSFFMINIFVGFVILTFTNEKEKEFAHCDMEKNQRDCIAFALKAKPITKYIPVTSIQCRFWGIVTSTPFEYISISLILLNTVSLCAKFYEQPESYTQFLDKVNVFFTIAFTIEFIFKFLALGVRSYFKDAWNVFDLIIVFVSYVDIVFKDVNVGVLKLFRVGRLIKLLNKNDGMRTILWTFGKSLQALPYIILLIILVFFIYSIVGMQTFAKIKLEEGTEIHRNCNFQSFGNTMLLLFRCSTGEGWQEIMMSCVDGEHVKCFFGSPNSTTTGGGHSEDRCGSDVAYGYFISFVVVCSFLVLNLFVAVIMDNFDYLTRDSSILGAHHLVQFSEYWSNYDPSATGKVKHQNLVGLLKEISPPLGFGAMCPRNVVEMKLLSMNMPINAEDGTVTFNGTLFSLVRASLAIKVEGNSCSRRVADTELRMLIMSLWKDTEVELLDTCVPDPLLENVMTLGKFYAAAMIMKRIKQWRTAKMLKCVVIQSSILKETKEIHKIPESQGTEERNLTTRVVDDYVENNVGIKGDDDYEEEEVPMFPVPLVTKCETKAIIGGDENLVGLFAFVSKRKDDGVVEKSNERGMEVVLLLDNNISNNNNSEIKKTSSKKDANVLLQADSGAEEAVGLQQQHEEINVGNNTNVLQVVERTSMENGWWRGLPPPPPSYKPFSSEIFDGPVKQLPPHSYLPVTHYSESSVVAAATTTTFGNEGKSNCSTTTTATDHHQQTIIKIDPMDILASFLYPLDNNGGDIYNYLEIFEEAAFGDNSNDEKGDDFDNNNKPTEESIVLRQHNNKSNTTTTTSNNKRRRRQPSRQQQQRRLLPQIPYWRYSCKTPVELVARSRPRNETRILPCPLPPNYHLLGKLNKNNGTTTTTPSSDNVSMYGGSSSGGNCSNFTKQISGNNVQQQQGEQHVGYNFSHSHYPVSFEKYYGEDGISRL